MKAFSYCNEHPKVSVLMACYNAERYLEKAIESILEQTFEDFELILLDDGSTDNSIKIEQQFALKDHRVRVEKNSTNQGLVFTRNRLLELAKGEYIAILDADDISYPQRLEVEIMYLEQHEDVDGISSACNFIDENGKHIGQLIFPPLNSNMVRAWLFFDDVIINSSSMFRRNIIVDNHLKYTDGYRVMEDYGLWTKYVVNGNWNVISTPLIEYRKSNSSTMHSLNNADKNEVKVIEDTIRLEYLREWNVTITGCDKERILSSLSMFRSKHTLLKKILCTKAYINLIFKARKVAFFKEFFWCALKIIKRMWHY